MPPKTPKTPMKRTAGEAQMDDALEEDRASLAASLIGKPRKAGAKNIVEVPDEYFEKYGLPFDYVVRTCALCDITSIDMCPFHGHKDVAAWAPFVPWGQGTFPKPAGNTCRICYYVFFHGGFTKEHKTIKAYLATMTSKGATFHQEFLESRQRYIALKLENPGLTLRTSTAIYPPRPGFYKRVMSHESNPKGCKHHFQRALYFYGS